MKLAIISGIAGQDGSLLASFLLSKDYKILGLLPEDRPADLFRLEFLNIKDRVQYRKIDLLDVGQVRDLFVEHKADEFYNLAAISSVGLSFKQPLTSFDFNTRSVLNLLEMLRQVSPSTRFYQASSSEMFGNVGVASLPIKESFLFHPVSPYGISKASAHWLTVNYREAYKLQACCGILFNHESALRPDNFVIKKIIRTAIDIKNGDVNFLELGNISVVRDWGYAPKYVEAMWRMMQQDTMSEYLICSSIPMSLEYFVQKVFDRLDLDSKNYMRLNPSLLRSLDLDMIYGDNSKAKKELDWSYDYDPDHLIEQLISDELAFMQWKRQRM